MVFTFSSSPYLTLQFAMRNPEGTGLASSTPTSNSRTLDETPSVPRTYSASKLLPSSNSSRTASSPGTSALSLQPHRISNPSASTLRHRKRLTRLAPGVGFRKSTSPVLPLYPGMLSSHSSNAKCGLQNAPGSFSSTGPGTRSASVAMPQWMRIVQSLGRASIAASRSKTTTSNPCCRESQHR